MMRNSASVQPAVQPFALHAGFVVGADHRRQGSAPPCAGRSARARCRHSWRRRSSSDRCRRPTRHRGVMRPCSLTAGSRPLIRVAALRAPPAHARAQHQRQRSASEPRHRVDAGLARLHIVLAAPFRVGRLGIITHVVVEHVDAARRKARQGIGVIGSRAAVVPVAAQHQLVAPAQRLEAARHHQVQAAGGFGTGCRRHERAPGPSPDRPRRAHRRT